VHTLFDGADRRGGFSAARHTGTPFAPEFVTKPAARIPHEPGAMTREQVVDRIITINPTATRGFLDKFKKKSLDLYLDHLQYAEQPRGPSSKPWNRPGDTPAICVFAHED